MPKTKQQKVEIVDKLAEKLSRAKILVFTSFSRRGEKGLDFKAMEGLKRDLKEVDSEYVVLKKTLLDLAVQKSSLSENVKVKEFEGSLGVLFGYKDIIEPLKALYRLSKGNAALGLYSGLTLENPEGVAKRPYGAGNKIISKDELVELANLPPREVLLSRLAGMIRYPLSGLANVLQGNIRGLAVALSQIKK